MRRTIVSIPFILSLMFSGCGKKELEAKLAEAEKALQAERSKTEQLEQEKQTLQEKIAALEASIAQINEQLNDLAQKAGITKKELDELRAEKAKQQQELAVYKRLFDRLKDLVDAGTINIEVRKGRLIVKLSNDILFDSGKTEIKTEGQAALTTLAQALSSEAGREFLIAGHTDNVPIKTSRYSSNWELSTARAISVVKFLIEQGMQASQIGAAGFSEFDPVSDNSTEEGRQLNRRIEIIFMPKIGSLPGLEEVLKGSKS